MFIGAHRVSAYFMSIGVRLTPDEYEQMRTLGTKGGRNQSDTIRPLVRMAPMPLPGLLPDRAGRRRAATFVTTVRVTRADYDKVTTLATACGATRGTVIRYLLSIAGLDGSGSYYLNLPGDVPCK